MKRKIIFTVTNDLSFDQRMHRICSALTSNGYECELIGRRRRASISLVEQPFQQRRISCLFEKGKLFYLEYNFRLFWVLLFSRTDIICSIDLDTLLPGFLAARITSKDIVYDAHEYFTELEEVISRPIVRKSWSFVERFCVPRIDYLYTISEGYAALFKEVYSKNFEVIRNVPIKREIASEPSDEKFIIYQGALNIGRGLEESILAMKNIDGVQLKIFGDGPIKSSLEALITEQNLENKVELFGAVSPEELRSITPNALIGLTLFSEVGQHHKYSMANRFFDYFHAGIPQIAMKFPEYENFNNQHQVAHLIDSLTVEKVTSAINGLLENPEEMNRLRSNCHSARDACNWQQESKKLVELYNHIP